MTDRDLEPGLPPHPATTPSSTSLPLDPPARGARLKTPKYRRNYRRPEDISHHFEAPPGTFVAFQDGTIYGRLKAGNLVKIDFR